MCSGKKISKVTTIKANQVKGNQEEDEDLKEKSLQDIL